MKFKYQTQFDRLPVNTVFSCNGNGYIKKSTRTASIVKPVEYSGTWFYFGKNELVNICKDDIVNLDSHKPSPNAEHWARLRRDYPAIERAK